MRQIFYPDIDATLGGSNIVAAFDRLPFADRALVIVEPGSRSWSTHILRQRDKLRIFDDFTSASYRRLKGYKHNPSSLISLYSQTEARTVTQFFREVEIADGPSYVMPQEHYSGRNMVNTFADLHLNCCAPTITDEHLPDQTDVAPALIREALERLFLDHLGVDLEDLLATRGTVNVTTGAIENSQLLSSIPLCPLSTLSLSSALRARPERQLAL